MNESTIEFMNRIWHLRISEELAKDYPVMMHLTDTRKNAENL